MATKDGSKLLSFANESLILVLADKPKKPKQQGIRNDRAVAVASILLTTATATGTAILSTVDPVTLFAGTPQLRLDDKSPPQPGTDQSTPIIQSVVIPSTADAETLRPTAKDVPTCEIRAPEPASRNQETDETSSEALFRKFQAWNAEQDARDLAKPVQDDPAPAAKNATASVRPVQKHRRAQAIRNARAEMIRDARERRRANVRRQNERAQARSIQDARAQAQYVQYAQPPVENAQQPSFLESLNPFGTNWLQH